MFWRKARPPLLVEQHLLVFEELQAGAEKVTAEIRKALGERLHLCGICTVVGLEGLCIGCPKVVKDAP